MTIQIVVPELSESVVEATVVRWLKREGDRVAVGEPVVELETEKVNIELGAERSGILVRVEKHEGEDVKVGDVLGVIEEVSEKVTQEPAEPPAQTRGRAEEGMGISQGLEKAPLSSSFHPKAEEQGTPSARRLAQEHGIDLTQVPSQKPGGRITREDVQRYLEQQKPSREGTIPAKTPPTPSPETPLPSVAPFIPPIPSADRREERIRMSRRRRTIARRLVEAQHTAAMLTTYNEVDMSAIMDIRKRRRVSFQERHGVNLGIVSFFVKATIGALKAFPQLNAEIQGDDIILKHYYDMGVAIGAREGLVVPVIREADHLTFAEIERAIKGFAQKAEEGTLSLEDLRGGTFTITNGGVFGSLLSTPILNPPQVGILGLHKIEERPIVRNGEIVVRPMMYVALSYDHRIVDGREAVQFLVKVKELIEDPETLLLES